MSADVMSSMPCVIAALVTLYARDRGISEQAAVVELVRVGLTHTILATTPESEKPGEGKSKGSKPERPVCSACSRTLPRRKLNRGSAGCRVCGRKLGQAELDAAFNAYVKTVGGAT